MKTFFAALTVVCLVSAFGRAATLDSHPHWKKGDRLPGLYYEVLAKSLESAARFQAPDGRFRSRLPQAGGNEAGWRVTVMQYIYVPALLYVKDHPDNPKKGDRATLEMALRAGDYLTSIIDENGRFIPVVNGIRTDPLDSHRWLYCWAESYGLLEPHLDQARKKAWREAIIRAGEPLVKDIRQRVDRPRYTAPWLGTSPNHFGLWNTTVYRIGMILGIDEWVKLTQPVLARFVREVAPGGYWAEHDGPTMNYDYLNSSVAGLYYHYSRDPEALRACRLSTDFHMHWCTPDGVDIQTVDERNSNDWDVNASWALFTFSNFSDGRRFARWKLLAALGDSDDPLTALGLEDLARIAQDAHYHVDGEETTIPQEMPNYRHLLDRPAVVEKKGDWTWSYSALVSVYSPRNQFFLDRIMPVSLWQAKTRHIIGGSNSKNQPELATFAVKRNGVLTAHPLDALIRGSEDSDTMFVADEGFSFWLVIDAADSRTATVRVKCETTYNSSDSVFLNLPLRLHPGAGLQAGSAGSFSLGDSEISLSGVTELSHNGWTVSLPPDSRLYWPFYTYFPYGADRVPKNLRRALGRLTVPLKSDGTWFEVRFRVD
ncbi:MAG: hypothetical protein V1794_06670 [Candidatus Glassbacteria bacterium]